MKLLYTAYSNQNERHYAIQSNHIMRIAITISPDRELYDAVNIMLRYNIGRIVVARSNNDNKNNNKPLGIITKKDIVRFVYNNTSGRNLHEVKVHEVMSAKLLTVSEASSLARSIRLRLDKKSWLFNSRRRSA